MEINNWHAGSLTVERSGLRAISAGGPCPRGDAPCAAGSAPTYGPLVMKYGLTL